MRRTVLVDVTAADIAGAKRGRFAWARCPIARALRRSGFRTARVASDRWDRGIDTPSTPLSRRARRFVTRFDAGLPVTPQRFRLTSPAGGELIELPFAEQLQEAA